MTVQDALDFIQMVRRSPDVQERIAAWGPAPSVAQLIELAGQLGFTFSPVQLQAAFRHDWTMRWVHHAGATTAAVWRGGRSP
jgi:hypothetical protein